MSAENAMIRRKVFLLRYSITKSKQTEAILKRLYREVEERLLREPSEFRNARLTALRDDIGNLLGLGFKEVQISLFDAANEIALDEASFLAKTLSLETNVMLSIPDAAIIERALRVDSLDVGTGGAELKMGEALKQFTTNKTREIQTIIADGVLLGDSTEAVAKRIALEAKNRPIDQVRTLARTLVSHSTSSAQKAFMKQNESILESEEWSATLDSRTTLLCAGRDGMTYPVGKGPYPPAHWNCRSLRIPVIKEEYATRGQDLKRDDFDSWLRKQTPDFQDEYFSQFSDGAIKSKLFRDGGLGIQQFRDETGRDVDIETLRNLEGLTLADILNG